ncbi:MAG: hypothetical protein ABI534_05370 [Chloroflexota bacterium]
MSGSLPPCRHTAGIVDRMLDDGLGGEDRQHVEDCATCAAALAEARRFEIALSRSAGGLVEEPLPRSALDAPAIVPRRRRSRTPGFVLAATVVVVLAVAVATSLASLGRNVGEQVATLAPVDASLALPGMTVDGAQDALLEVGMACVPNDKGGAGLRCIGHDPGTGASLHAALTQAGSDGVAELKATMSVPIDEAAMASKGPQMGTEQVSRRVSDDAFVAFFEPLAELPFSDGDELGQLEAFLERTIGGANGSCQCVRRIGEVHVELEGSVGWSWDLVIRQP